MLKEIHTGFYTTEAQYILERMFYILSCSRFHSSKRVVRTSRHTNTSIAPNGEVMITVSSDTLWNTSFSRLDNDIDARDWLAYLLKNCVYNELDTVHYDSVHSNWARDNKTRLEWFSEPVKTHIYWIAQLNIAEWHDITVDEVYCMYDLLRNRKNTDKRYSAKLIEKLVGHENDPFTTEQENIRRNEIARITSEKKNKRDELYREAMKKKSEFEKQIDEEYKKLMNESDKAFDEQIRQLNESFAMMSALAVA